MSLLARSPPRVGAWNLDCLFSFIIVLILIFLGEVIINCYVLRSTPAIISINTVLQRNQSCTNPEVVVPCTSEAEE